MDVDNEIATTVAGDDSLAVVRIEATPGLDQEAGFAVNPQSVASSQADDDDSQGGIAARLEDRRGVNMSQPHRTTRRDQAATLLARAFGPGQLKLRVEDQCTFWPSVVCDLKGFDQLGQVVRESVIKYGEKAVGTYVGCDVRTGDVAIYSHHPYDELGPFLNDDLLPIHLTSAQAPTSDNTVVMTADDHETLLEAIHHNIDDLLAPNTIAIYPSACVFVKGVPHAEPCICVVVWAKGIVSIGSWVLPTVVDGIRVDVIEGLPFLRQVEYDPLSAEGACDISGSLFPGSGLVSTASRGLTSIGTFASILERNGLPFGLTAGHVLGAEESHVYTQFDYDRRVKTVVGVVAECRKGTRQIGRVPAFVDCGWFKLKDEANIATCLNPSLAESWRTLTGETSLPTLSSGKGRTLLPSCSRGASASAIVYKHGRTSGLTDGIVQHSGVCQLSDGYFSHRGMKVHVSEALFVNKRSFDRFSEGGDSGALVFKRSGQIVGMAFAGNESFTVASFIEDIEAVFGGQLVVS
jgi:hypothetical protein